MVGIDTMSLMLIQDSLTGLNAAQGVYVLNISLPYNVGD